MKTQREIEEDLQAAQWAVDGIEEDISAIERDLYEKQQDLYAAVAQRNKRKAELEEFKRKGGE